jgi:hypothetical protein
MKRLLVLIIVLAMTTSLVACGENTATKEATPAVSAPAEEAGFTEEQIALAEDYLSMAEEFDAVADMVNASPELLENEELVTAMNELAEEIIKLDEFFESPETLTPEVIAALSEAIDLGCAFIAEAREALEEIGQ